MVLLLKKILKMILLNLAKNFIRNGLLIGILLMRQPDNMKAAQGAGLDMNSLDFEFMTKGDPILDAQDAAGRIQQNLTPEEVNEMAELAPYAEKFMMLSLKAETGQVPSEQDVDQLLAQLGQEMPSTGEQGMSSEQGSGAMVPQDGQMQQRPPPQAVEGQMPQNAPEMMSRGGEVGLEAAKDIVREKYPQQAKYLDDLNIVIKPDMEGHSEYRSGDYDDSKEYGYKHTIEINPKYSKTPEEIASTIAGETLHHMKDKDPEFRKMWTGLRETLGQDTDFRKVQERRQGAMNRRRQEEFIREGRYKNPISNRGPYNDMRDVDHFIDASALDEWIRAYQFKDDPIAGKHYFGWEGEDGKGDEFHNEYKDKFEGIRQYLGKGMAAGGVAAGPVGVINQSGADGSGVADDVPAKSDGFVINAAAVRHAGLKDINEMIQGAKEYAEKKGIKLDLGKTPMNAEDILVSNGEVLVSDKIANIIGYDRLEKINNRGKKETEEKLAEQEQQPTAMQPQQPVMQAALGGGILEEQDMQKEMATIESQMDNALPEPAPVEDYGKMDKAIENADLSMVYGYTKDQLYDGISKYEWRNQTPRFGFAGIDSNKNTKVTSAFGPAQITSFVMDDIINDSKNFGVGKEALQLATNIRAAQTLVINLGNGFKTRGGFDPRKAANTPKGKIALQTLGISSEEFQSMVEEGFFLPSTDPKAKGLPDSILGQNYEQNYRKLFDATLQIKQNRTDVTDLNSLLEKYHGSEDKLANGKYRDGVLTVLDIMKSK
jgi:hypothetical protein